MEKGLAISNEMNKAAQFITVEDIKRYSKEIK